MLGTFAYFSDPFPSPLLGSFPGHATPLLPQGGTGFHVSLPSPAGNVSSSSWITTSSLASRHAAAASRRGRPEDVVTRTTPLGRIRLSAPTNFRSSSAPSSPYSWLDVSSHGAARRASPTFTCLAPSAFVAATPASPNADLYPGPQHDSRPRILQTDILRRVHQYLSRFFA